MQLALSTSSQVKQYLERSRTLVLPMGSTEQHGPIGLIGTDTLCAQSIAQALGEARGVLVAPPIAPTVAPLIGRRHASDMANVKGRKIAAISHSDGSMDFSVHSSSGTTMWPTMRMVK